MVPLLGSAAAAVALVAKVLTTYGPPDTLTAHRLGTRRKVELAACKTLATRISNSPKDN